MYNDEDKVERGAKVVKENFKIYKQKKELMYRMRNVKNTMTILEDDSIASTQRDKYSSRYHSQNNNS